MVVEYPDFVARFYDTVYDQIRTGVDHDYFVRLMSGCSGSVLEVGVGTGRMFVDALNAGADAYGIDVSEQMIDQLHGKISPDQRDRVTVMDVTRLDFARPFEMIVAPFRVFSHLIEVADQLQALNAIAAHLTENGQFVFDLFTPNYALMATPHDRHIDFEGEYEPGETLRRIVSMTNHPATQVNQVTFDFEWTEGGLAKNNSWSFPMRYYFRYELEHLIARSDLELIDMDGDYEGGPLTDGSKDYVIRCRKRCNIN